MQDKPIMQLIVSLFSVALALVLTNCASTRAAELAALSDTQRQEPVLRDYPYVAMFNVNNKFALDPDNPMFTGGYNRVFASTALADHTLRAIARPNNDTRYVSAMVDFKPLSEFLGDARDDDDFVPWNSPAVCPPVARTLKAE